MSIAKLEYEYHTADTPDHTINATGFRFVYDRDPADSFYYASTYSSGTIPLAAQANWTVVDTVNARITIETPRTGCYESMMLCTVLQLGDSNAKLQIKNYFGLSNYGGATVPDPQRITVKIGVATTSGDIHSFYSNVIVKSKFYLTAGITYNIDLYFKATITEGLSCSIQADGTNGSLVKILREIRECQ